MVKGEKNMLVENILKRANICGAMACQKKGAMSSLPTKFELEVFTRQINM